MPDLNPVRLHAAAPDNTPSRRTSWRDRALCMEVDPELFFPDQTRTIEARMAKAVCATCPVRAECLAYAQRNNIIDGIFGGLDETQRNALRKAMA